ncbi:choline dehydrogenase-like flavoprotein [Polaromonas sp. CG_9.11]|nr:choline dehydrogenase-like flavoprotein [Polaromonas sp. CG_9.11]
MQRRTLLTLGLASSVALAVGAAGWLLQPGLQQDGLLSPAGRGVFAAVGRAVLDKTLPAEEGERHKAVAGLLARIDTLAQALSPHAQAELSQLLAVLARAPGQLTLAGLGQPWGQASSADLQLVLQDMRLSGLALRQQAYAALHDIATGAYFADAPTWTLRAIPARSAFDKPLLKADLPMSSLNDPIREGLQRGWKVLGGTLGAIPEKIACDVAIIGSGAGAGITAELLARAGLQVVMVEEGPLKSSSDFSQLESEAYPALYQESAARKTEDKAINILQGRCVGGSTTGNWTSSLRTPASTLKFWQDRFGLAGYSKAALAPYFAQAEQRLNIALWQVAPTENNALLGRGAGKLGIYTEPIARNVKGCWNLGSCGLGCPTNAKQSMLVTTISAALDLGAQLLTQTRAEHFELANGRGTSLMCRNSEKNGALAQSLSASCAIKIVANNCGLAGGAINSPAVLLRSGAPDPHGRLGGRTFLHPVVMSSSLFDQKVEAWNGAPQSIYTDHFLPNQPIDGALGYKLEAPPLHPLIFASTVPGFGQGQHDLLRSFPHKHTLLALLRDGFHDEAPGGQVKLRGDGSAVLDYPLGDCVMQGARRALLSMMEIQFAAGARQVLPLHEMAVPYNSWAQAREAMLALPMKPRLVKMVSAHVMGGCGLADSPGQGVTRPDGMHWQLDNLSIHNGSIFPTSIGANPQLSVYGAVNRLAQGLAKTLTGRDVALA